MAWLPDNYVRPLAVIPNDADLEWHRFRGDLAAVHAAIASLADGFQLRSVGDNHWELRSSEPELRGDLVIRTDTGTVTLVGLRLAATPGESALAEAVEFMRSAWPLWLILVILGAVSGLPLTAGLLGVVAIAIALVPPVALVIAAFEAQRVRQDREWIADWRARFLPALTAHLTIQQPYR